MISDALASLKAERDYHQSIINCELSLYTFLKEAWPQIEGATPFIPGWHIQAVCEHLEAAMRGEIKKLLINVPPRTSKTNIISIMLPAWVWTADPGIKFLYASYKQSVSLEHSRICRLLIASPWYQERWGHLFAISKDQDTKGHFTNTAFGHRIATSVGGSATAWGGDVIICDDANSASDSQVTRESTNDWLARTWPSRLNPGGLGINIQVQQRINEMDASGALLERDANNEWVKLILPMEFEESRRCKTIVLPSTNGRVWEDLRLKEGELLCPKYLSASAIQDLKTSLGSYNYAGQYQQRPAPESGGILKREWFKVWDKPNLPKLSYVLQSWDTALTATETSAYSACTTWGIFKLNHIPQVMLLTAYRAKLSYPELVKRAARLRDNYLDIDDEPLEPDYRRQPDRILIEAKASGVPLASDLVSKGIPATTFMPDAYGDKLQRVHMISSYIECGRAWVASLEPGDTVLLADHEMLVYECTLFPKGESRDIVDTLSQAFLHLVKDLKLLTHVMNPRFEGDKKDDRK